MDHMAVDQNIGHFNIRLRVSSNSSFLLTFFVDYIFGQSTKMVVIVVAIDSEGWPSIDSIFTGVSEESLNDLLDDQHDVESLRTRPSICLLKRE